MYKYDDQNMEFAKNQIEKFSADLGGTEIY